MIRIKNHKQQELFDPWAFLSPKRRRMLDESWPGLFREYLLCELPVEKLRPFLRDDFGRPSKELYTLLGVLLFQQTMDLNDHDAVRQLSFNIEWHYALNISEESDTAKYVSEKTLWTWRQILTENELDQVIFDNISEKLANVFSVNTDSQRIDSVHIKSNMRKLGRIGIFSQTIHKFLINLKRHHCELFTSIGDDLLERYISGKALSAFSLVKPSESSKTLQVVSADLFELIEQFKDQPSVCAMHSYKLMERVLKEQCNVQADDIGRKLSIKEPKHISSESLQNPSDPDSTYSGHKGQGYQVQIMETFSATQDKKEKEQTLNLITHVAVEKACEHDSHALMPAIQDTHGRGLGPKTVLADTLYGGDDNKQSAKEEQVDLVSPAFKGGNSTGMNLSDFTYDDNGYVTACPAGYNPVKVGFKKKTNRYNARFELNQCSGCPHVAKCPIQSGRKNYYLRYTAKDQRLAVRRIFENSKEFIDIYRWRAGVEGTMSQYDALTGVKNLRVRGFTAVQFCATLKAAGLNLLRAAAVRRARYRAKTASSGSFLRFVVPFLFVKERIYKLLSGLGKMLSPRPYTVDYYIKSAA
jgi:hypothetical protein